MTVDGGGGRSRPEYHGSASVRYELRKLRGLPSPWVDATRARVHIQGLVAMGISAHAIALAAGVNSGTVSGLVSGAHLRVYRHTLVAILAVDHRPHPAQTRVLSIGACRRVHALAAMGWSGHAVSAELGTSSQCLSTLIRRRTMTYQWWAAIAEVYGRLGARVGPSRKALVCARNRRWPTPLAWEGIDLDDPCARADTGSAVVGAADPQVVERALSGDHTVRLSIHEKQECARRARTWGWSARLFADRLGITPSLPTGL